MTKHLNVKEWIAWKIEGMTYHAIAERAGCSSVYVQHRLRPSHGTRELLKRRAKNCCEACHAPTVRGECHHRLDTVRTVDTYQDPANLEWLCRSCHGKRHTWDWTPWRKRRESASVFTPPPTLPTAVNGHPVHCTEPPVTVAGLTWYYLKATEGKAHWQWCHETGQIV